MGKMIFDNKFTNSIDVAVKQATKNFFNDRAVEIALRHQSLSDGIDYFHPPLFADRHPVSHRLVSPPEERGKEVTLTRIVDQNHLHLFFHGFEKYDDCLQPGSLDVVVERFYDSKGKKLDFPVRIKPQDSVICESDIEIDLNRKVFACIETKSSVARIGLSAVGFSCDGEYEIFLKGYKGKIAASVKNFGSRSVVINKPSALFQVTVSERYTTTANPLSYDKPHIYLTDDEGKIVNRQNEVKIGNILGYKLHITPELWSMTSGRKGVDFDRRKEADGHFIRSEVGEADLQDNDFCLALSREYIRTGDKSGLSRCPAYVFPFHYKNIFEKLHKNMSELESLKAVFKQVFLENNGDYLPVTCNAGMCNAGWHGRVVFENITRGVKDVSSYFNPDQPFALLIPLPFIGQKENDYNGAYNGQKGIQL